MNPKRFFGALIATALCAASPAYAAAGSDVKVSLEGGQLKFATEDGDFEAQIGGRIQADYAFFNDDPKAGHGAEFRRARLYFKGLVWGDWEFRSQIDFANAGSDEDEIDYKDLYLKYKGAKSFDFIVGNFIGTFGLEGSTSSKHLTFMEPSMIVSTFAPFRNFGIGAQSKGRDWSLDVGVHTGNEKFGSNNYGLVARGVYTHRLHQDGFLHGGIGVSYFNYPGSDTSVRVRQRYGAHLTDFRPASINAHRQRVDTLGNPVGVPVPGPASQSILAVDSVYVTGFEGAAVYRNFSIQGEYMRADYDSGFDSSEADGFYVQVSAFLTPGDRRAYKGQTFTAVSPKAPFGREGGIGAWEVAIRYDSLDLSDINEDATVGMGVPGKDCDGVDAPNMRCDIVDAHGSDVDVLTLGVNWYPNSNVRFTANYVHVLSAEVAGLNTIAEPAVFQLRAQVAF